MTKPATQIEAMEIAKFKTCDFLISSINEKISLSEVELDNIYKQDDHDMYNSDSSCHISALSAKISTLKELRDEVNNILFPGHKFEISKSKENKWT